MEHWLSSFLTGAFARLGHYSGEMDLPRRTGGRFPCRWHYIPIPSIRPDYHLTFYTPIEVPRVGPRMPLDRSVLTPRERQVIDLLFAASSNKHKRQEG